MSYFDLALEPKKLRCIAKDTKKILKILGIKVDNIVGRGTSGVLPLPVFGEVLGAAINVSRKKETAHSSSPIESISLKPLENWAIIDDFISSGETVDKIIESVESFHKRHDYKEPDRPVLIVLYAGEDEYGSFDFPIVSFEETKIRFYNITLTQSQTLKLKKAFPDRI